jgi:glycosyltransferase involved in cell wall biosynthesis
LRLAYLVSTYPAVSHTFIAREIAVLRDRGHDVTTISVRRTPEAQLLTDEERAEAARTENVLPVAPQVLLRDHLQALGRRPGAYLRTLRLALALGDHGPRDTLWSLFYFAEAVRVWRLLRARGLQHLHVHFANAAATVALLAAELGRGDGMTWSFTMHGPREFDDVEHFALPEKVRRASFVACIGEFCRAQLMRFSDEDQWAKLEIVRCGLDPTVFAPRTEPADDGVLRVLCVGRLVADKGQSLLVEAVARLRRDGVPVEAHLVGDGPSRPRIEQAVQRLGVQDAVHLHGSVGQDRIRELYAAADVFCLPTFAEGVPVVLMEAMAMEVPVITTAVQGIPELVEPGRTGVLVRPGSVDVLVEALRGVAQDGERFRSLAVAGRERVERDYDIRANAAGLEACFERWVA